MRAVAVRVRDLLGLLKKRDKADTEAEAPETESEAVGEGADEATGEPGRFDQLGARLHAWWEGYDFEPAAPDASSSPAETEKTAASHGFSPPVARRVRLGLMAIA